MGCVSNPNISMYVLWFDIGRIANDHIESAGTPHGRELRKPMEGNVGILPIIKLAGFASHFKQGDICLSHSIPDMCPQPLLSRHTHPGYVGKLGGGKTIMCPSRLLRCILNHRQAFDGEHRLLKASPRIISIGDAHQEVSALDVEFQVGQGLNLGNVIQLGGQFQEQPEFGDLGGLAHQVKAEQIVQADGLEQPVPVVGMRSRLSQKRDGMFSMF